MGYTNVMEPHVYKEKLIAELATVTTELESVGVRDPNVPEDWVATPAEPADGEADTDLIADRNEDGAERQGELDALEIRYNNIRRALLKIEAGTFGNCEICGEPIESARLEVNPSARTCITHREQESELGV